MSYNYSKLLGRIREKNLTQEKLAEMSGMNVSSLSQRLNNKRSFRQKDIIAICKILDIAPEEIGLYFFTH